MSASEWHGLPGNPGYLSGTSGTVTLPANAILIAVTAHASVGGASLAIFGGASIPIVNGGPPFAIDFKHANFQAHGNGAQAQLVFTNTDSYFVHFVKTGHA